MLCIKLPPFPLLTRNLTYLQQCSTVDHTLIFYSFSRLIAIVANTNAREHILATRIKSCWKNKFRTYTKDDRVVRIALERIKKLENEGAEKHFPHVVA